jgi:uncharacterized RDD family membrane protein YckC
MSKPEQHTSHPDQNEITIDTLSTPPPKILPAPPLRRFIACVTDSLIIGAVYLALTIGVQGSAMLWKISENLFDVAFLIALTFAYYFVQEGLFATTIGKSILRLRVLGKDGEPCSFGASFTRNILRILDWLPFLYLIAAVAMLTSPDRQRIGDKMASTIVTRAPEKDINPPPAPFLFH